MDINKEAMKMAMADIRNKLGIPDNNESVSSFNEAMALEEYEREL
jgi:hypothetical protein